MSHTSQIVANATDFASAFSMSRQTAWRVLKAASEGKRWRGHSLPVIELDGQRGGASGKVWGLVLDRCAPDLRAKFGVEAAVDLPVEAPVELPLQRLEDWQVAEQVARFDIIAPALEHPRFSKARAAVLRDLAGRVHAYPGGRQVFSYNTLRKWMTGYEQGGHAALLPAQRCDKGKAKVLITRLWDAECGLDDAAKLTVNQELDRKAKGYVAKGNTSLRTLARLCQAHLMRLSAEAGSPLALDDLRRVCMLNIKWAARFNRHRLVFQHDRDHKQFSDRHEARVTRSMEAVPMDVLMGDVHHVDMWIAPEAEPVTVKLIGWMDAASGFLWATPVIVNNRQGIKQADVAKSLFEVCACPWGGMPRTFVLDNGSEYKALTEAMARLSDLADMSPGFGVIKCKPYSPESKGRLEGAFNIFKGIIKDLPGYIGGDRMKKPTQSKGKPVARYPHGERQLIEDLRRALEIYNGTPQGGMLGGLSPKAVFEAKAKATGFAARVPTPEMFDFVFSREERRNVRNGAISLNGRAYYGDILAELIGECRVAVHVPLREPTGPALILHDGALYPVMPETYAHTGGNGARRQGQLRKAGVAVVRDLRREADMSVSEFDDRHALADKGQVACPAPDTWQMPAIDKTGRLSGPDWGPDPEAAEEAEAQAFAKEFFESRGITPGKAGPTEATAGPARAT